MPVVVYVAETVAELSTYSTTTGHCLVAGGAESTTCTLWLGFQSVTADTASANASSAAATQAVRLTAP